MLYFDSSALVKCYVREEGTSEAIAAMREARRWASCRVGFVETSRVVGRVGRQGALKRFQVDWSSFNVVEIDLVVAEEAAELAVVTGLRSLDAVHLAAALALSEAELTFATWDVRLHRAARDRGLTLLPECLPT
jgi:predicted nucleic acid-binding protein